MFPSKINTKLAVGVAGDFASVNPHASVLNPVEGSLICGPDGVTIGRFAWIDANGVASNTGTGAPAGFVHRHQSATIYDFMGEFGNTIPRGQPVDLMSRGDFWVDTQTNATIGQAVFANNTDGSVHTGTRGSTVPGCTETIFMVASSGVAGDAIKITPWSNVR